MIATYRLQLRPGFGFAEVQGLLPYLARLGISHLYLSPITEARPGSTHGYDVVDHNRVREELGGAEAFEALLEEVARRGLRVILDIVPNHADAGPANDRWQDVLAYGPGSPYAGFFDIEWEPLKPELRRKVLLPFLGRPYGEALDAGEITLVAERERFFAAYFAHRFAIAPATYPEILAEAGRPDLAEAYRAAAEGPADGARERLEALRPHLAGALRTGAPDALASFTGPRLHGLLQRQFWRLAYWRTAGYEINYRRFFYVNELVALRVEDPRVFDETHRLVARLAAHPAVEGVRVDHVDGLFDPHAYLARLRALGVRRVWVEKILAPGETLPEEWPVEGTTGYDFLNDALGVLTPPEAEAPLDRLYRRTVRDRPSYRVEVYRSKRAVMERHLVGELDRLAYDLDRISEADYHTRDLAYEALREAVVELIAELDRYRTYLPHRPEQAEEILRQAAHRARRRTRWADPSVFEFLLQVLRGEVPADQRARAPEVAGRFQQYASVVMAKGVEDTAFYRYVRLAALNEVGGEPDRIGLRPEVFHARARFRAVRYPRTLLATATHDHKRGEDLRMRMAAIAAAPEEWERAMRALRPLIRQYGGDRPPEAGDVYLFCQTLAGLWPGEGADELTERLSAYMLKAAREAKLQTGWSRPDPDYEAALDRFVRGMLADARLGRRLAPIAATLRRVGFTNGITQLILKLTAPGVPDIYQGAELLDLSLVDPDNRRPVDFARRERLCREVEPLVARPDAAVLRGWLDAQDERLKLYVLRRLLRFRRSVPEVFEAGYRPLAAAGADRVLLAFAREHERGVLVVAVPRRPVPARTEAGGERGRPEALLPEGMARGEATEVLTGARQPAGAVRLDGPLPWKVLWAAAGRG